MIRQSSRRPSLPSKSQPQPTTPSHLQHGPSPAQPSGHAPLQSHVQPTGTSTHQAHTPHQGPETSTRQGNGQAAARNPRDALSTHHGYTPSSPSPEGHADAVISTNKLSKSFSTDSLQQHVLKNLDLDIVRGDFTVIMGRSGAGKSTLLHALSGMDSPSLGNVIFDGTDISAMSQDKLATFRRSHCGFVFQQINLLDSITLADNVLVPGLLGRAKRADVVARANEFFDLVGLNEVTRKKFPAVVSGGEAQRAAIVRALINEPDVLFADEPTGQLDSANSTLVLDLLTKVNRDGQSIVMVTHDLASALRGNRIIYLLDGTIHGELTLDPYVDDAEHRSAALSSFLSDMGWKL